MRPPELLLRAFGGGFARSNNPWIKSNGRTWVDADAITDEALFGLSDGEQRLLRIVRSLAGGEPVNLDSDLPGLDRSIVKLVLAATSHASGVHEHGGGPVFIDNQALGAGANAPSSLYPWPN